jgi:carbon-monoxide dehydrogenase large subunit
VGGVSAFSNAVIDAFAHLGVTHLPMPHTAYRVWQKWYGRLPPRER